MNSAPADQRGHALGAWGAVQATAAGVAMATSSVIRDVVGSAAGPRPWLPGVAGPATGYTVVYLIEIILLCVAVGAMAPLVFRWRRYLGTPHPAGTPGPAAAHARAAGD
jgi:BCD family chlorophyll transporter-like MFS transporter